MEGIKHGLAGVALGFRIAVPAGTQSLAVVMPIGVDDYRIIGLTANWNAGHIWWRSPRASGFTLNFALAPEDTDGEVHGRIEL